MFAVVDDKQNNPFSDPKSRHRRPISLHDSRLGKSPQTHDRRRLMSSTDSSSVTHLSASESLSGKLQHVLRRGRGLRESGKAPVSSEQLLEHTLRVSEVLHSEYTEKQSLALDAIHNCRRLLHEERNKQLADVEKCRREKDALIVSITRMRDKLLDVRMRQTELSDRVTAFLSSIKNTGPKLTPAETEMRSDLENVRLMCEYFSRSLTELRARHQFQSITKNSIELKDHPDQESDHSIPMSSEEQRLLELGLKQQMEHTRSLSLRIQRLNQLMQLMDLDTGISPDQRLVPVSKVSKNS